MYALNMIIVGGLLVAAFVYACVKAAAWYSAWLDSDHDPETGAPLEREPLGKALIRTLKAPGEKKRREREAYRHRLETLPPDARSYSNPFGKKAIRELLICLGLIAAFFLAVYGFRLLRQSSLASWTNLLLFPAFAVMFGLLLRNLYLLILYTAGWFKFRAYKKRHPEQKYDVEAFLQEQKAVNGSYHPSDFGK